MPAMTMPTKAKQLAALLDDGDLKQKIYNLIARHDAEFLQELNAALAGHMGQKLISLRSMEPKDIEKAFQIFFKKNRMAGDYIKTY
jgi:hypothetical protein